MAPLDWISLITLFDIPYLVKSVGWLVAAEVVLESKLERVYHHFQWM